MSYKTIKRHAYSRRNVNRAIVKYSAVIYISIPKKKKKKINQETLCRTSFPPFIDFYIKNQIQSQVNKDKTMNVLIFL